MRKDGNELFGMSHQRPWVSQPRDETADGSIAPNPDRDRRQKGKRFLACWQTP